MVLGCVHAWDLGILCFPVVYKDVWKDVACVASRVYPKKKIVYCLVLFLSLFFSFLDLVSSVSGRHVAS